MIQIINICSIIFFIPKIHYPMVTSIILIAIYLLFAISNIISNIKLPKKTMQHIMKK